MSEYTIIRLESGNLHHLYSLHEQVYGKKRTQGYFEKKYDTAYTGIVRLGFIALYENKPAAYYGIIPTFVSISNTKVLAAQSCDTMTHPKHQRKGLFVQLAERTFQLAKKSGIHFVFGFPNQNSFSGFVKHLGFTHSETMNRYTFEFKNTFYNKIYRKLFAAAFGHKNSFIANSLLEEGHDGLIYDAAWLKYKSFNANAIFEEEHYQAWISTANGVWLGAFDCSDSSSLKNLMEALAKKIKAASIICMVSSGTNTDHYLSELKKAEPGFAVILKDLSGSYPLDKLKFQFADIDIF